MTVRTQNNVNDVNGHAASGYVGRVR